MGDVFAAIGLLVMLAWGVVIAAVAMAWLRVEVEDASEVGEVRVSRVVIEDLVDRLTDLPPALTKADIIEIETNGTCRDPWRDWKGRAA